MTDEFAIQQTISRYSVNASRADWDKVMATFAPGSVWAVPALGVKFEGLDEIRGGLLHFSGPMDYIVQAHAPAVIEVDGDTATAQSVIRENGKFSGRDEALEILGLYLDKLVRTADGWKFVERVFDLRGMYSFPLSPPPEQ
jgi:ketosteroid isomerase-like protein